MPFRSITVCFLLTFSFIFQLFAQTTIQGVITDINTEEEIVGAQIMITDTAIGTLSQPDGSFLLNVFQKPPLKITVSALGYTTQQLEITQKVVNLDLKLSSLTDSVYGVVVTTTKVEETVATVSKIEEEKEKAPMTAYKLGLLSIRENPSWDIHSALGVFPEVQINAGSLTFSSVNTRGFADAQNWRFVTLVDGVDVIAPGLNYTVPNLLTGSEHDFNQVEIVSGPGSALYGPNAFNGIISIKTKSPFDYEGISGSIQAGISAQKGIATHPLAKTNLRIAKKLNDKLAFKINLGYMRATDWEANDESHYISNTTIHLKEELLQRERTHPNFNAVSVYGDEIAVPVDLGQGTPVIINRSGLKEKDIVDYGIENIKAGIALHYRPKKTFEIIYDYKFVQGDAILRHTTTYPFRDIQHHNQKLEVRSSDFFVRAYHIWENAQNSYAMLATGAFIQEGLKSSQLWSRDYGAAFRGEIPGIKAGDHQEARTFADRDISGPESELFQTLRNATLNNPNISTGGSQFIERSNLVHVEGNYDLSNKLSFIGIQVGGSFRKYTLNSEGQLFNDGLLGFGRSIPIEEYGAYLQATRSFFKDHLTFRGSVRWDKNQNFLGRITPRGAVIISLGEKVKHNLRFTAQTGFRNPASQETYIALDLGEATILGGTEDNIANYSYPIDGGGTLSGTEIHSNLFTIESVTAFLQTGGTDPSKLVPANLSFLKQEQIKTLELGYDLQLGKNVAFGFNIYQNIYQDLVSRITAFSLSAQRPFAVYTNIEEKITAQGASFNIETHILKGFKIAANYSWSTYDADEALEKHPGFLPSFNAPPHRVNASIGHRDLGKGFGFILNYRWSDEFIWQSPFGQGVVESNHQLDAAVSLQLPEIHSMVKIGGSNLLRDEYRSIYGGPYIGSIYYVNFTIDQFKWKK